MSVLLKIAWRNIWRHPGRSGVLLAAIMAGIWAGVTVAAITNGFVKQRMDRLIEEISHIQIHHPEFRSERLPELAIPDSDRILRLLETDPRVEIYSERVITDGMIQSPVTTAGVEIRGVDPERENLTTGIGSLISNGEYFGGEAINPLLIGRKLADRLRVGVGTRVVLTFQDLQGELTSAAFLITGIYTTASPMAERVVYTRLPELSGLLSPDSPVLHEIAVRTLEEEQTDPLAADLSAQFPEAESLPWHALSPELRIYSEIGNQTTYYLMIVILLALAFGILNTMLMAIFERIRELGMLMAIGMNKVRIFAMITLESLLITLTGTFAGLLLSWFSVQALHRKGLDLTAFGEGLMEFGYDPVVYPEIGVEELIGIIMLVALVAILASVYPALRAIRLQPVAAMRG